MKIPQLIKNLIILLPLTFAIIATSKTTGSLPTTWNFTSTCSNAYQASGSIEVTGSSITSPSGKNFTDLGLPVSSLSIGSDSNISGEIAPALTRTCTLSTSSIAGVSTHTYSCSDNSIPSCEVVFSP